jgi:shikimate kinase/3-dehydroquinate synthase
MSAARAPERLALPPLGPERHIYLSGPMGAGKSTIARRLAASLGRPAVDLDAAIEARAGRSVADLFRERGEAAFRDLEAELALEHAEHREPLVVALGGGTVVRDAVRRALVTTGHVLTLDARPEVLAARTAGSARPLLAGTDAASRLAALRAERAAAYAEAHAVIDAEGEPDAVLCRVREALAARPVLVALGARSYRVTCGALEGVAAELSGEPVLLVADPHTRVHAERLLRTLEGRGDRVTMCLLPSGEEHKHAGSLGAVWDACAEAGLDRRSWIVAVGGGVVGDVAGLAAATWMRGIRWGTVPTTLLAMADSAIGGKTAIDHPRGKNLVGAFHQPSFVRVDASTLATLPERERLAGLAEVVKCAWLAGEEAVADLERRAGALRAGEPDATADAVLLAARVKARIVADDEAERGPRMALNLGHTLGHAIESASGFALRHGEAVSLGLVAACQLARHHGVDAEPARMAALLSALGLPTDLGPWRGHPALVGLVGADKKRGGGLVRCLLPGAPGSLWTLALAPEAVVSGANLDLAPLPS